MAWDNSALELSPETLKQTLTPPSLERNRHSTVELACMIFPITHITVITPLLRITTLRATSVPVAFLILTVPLTAEITIVTVMTLIPPLIPVITVTTPLLKVSSPGIPLMVRMFMMWML